MRKQTATSSVTPEQWESFCAGVAGGLSIRAAALETGRYDGAFRDYARIKGLAWPQKPAKNDRAKFGRLSGGREFSVPEAPAASRSEIVWPVFEDHKFKPQKLLDRWTPPALAQYFGTPLAEARSDMGGSFGWD